MSKQGIFKAIMAIAILTAVAAVVALGFVNFNDDYQLADQFPFIVSVTPTPTLTPTPRPTPTPTPTPTPAPALTSPAEQAARNIENAIPDNDVYDVSGIEFTEYSEGSLLFFWVVVERADTTDEFEILIDAIWIEAQKLLTDEDAVFAFFVVMPTPYDFFIATQAYWFTEDMYSVDNELVDWREILYFQQVGQRVAPEVEMFEWFGIGVP
jgi:hypothetical protein